MGTIAVAGTFDTKGREYQFIIDQLHALGAETLTIHAGVFDPIFEPDVSNKEVAAAAGYDLDEIAEKRDRALGTEALSKGMEAIVPKLYAEGKFDGILALGGSGGTSLATPAMRALPVGVPKVMVSTMASGNVEQYVGTSDVIMIPSIVDVAGLNSISKTIFRNAALAVAGMVGLKNQLPEETEEAKPLVAATMFGVTTPCINRAQAYLEEQGYEVLVFHATGTGGRTMESLIDSGYFKGVLDLTTTEWCDEVVGGVLAAGEHRCEAAVRQNVPQVVSVGALDMVNFGPRDTVPEEFLGRNLYQHNPTVTLMRTTAEENRAIGERLVSKWNETKRKMTVLLPKKGVSMIDAEGQAFYGPEEDAVLFDTLRQGLTNPLVEIVEMDNNINDEAFAVAAAKKLIELMEE